MNDPRLTLAREGLADARLEGLIEAGRFVETRPHHCAVALAAIRKTPDAAGQEDELIFGEAFDVLEEQGGFAFGQARRDGYVGWVETIALAQGLILPTHQVSATSTIAFGEPDWKSAPRLTLPMNSFARVTETVQQFAHVEGAGWVFAGHLSEISSYEDDPVAVAAKFLGAPYLWGGRTAAGIDCSGLVQQAWYACGRAMPRDSDMQAALGQPWTNADATPGGLVFWTGHVGILAAGHNLIHATAHVMQTVDEPLADVIARNEASGNGAPIAYLGV